MNDKPFYRTKTDEEREEEPGEVISVRLNPKEREALNNMKRLLDVKSDGKAIKLTALIGIKLLHSTFGDDILRLLFKKERLRLSDFEKI